MLGCASALDRGESLYRQGDVRGALEVWRAVPQDSNEYGRVQARLEIVEAEFARMLQRYAKRAAFFESEGRIAEALLYYRLAYNMDPGRQDLLEHVQALARQLREAEGEQTAGLRAALEAGDLKRASTHAETLERLNPFDPAVQLEVRQVRAESGARVLKHLALGEQAYAAGEREAARAAFQRVLELDPRNEAALGYLSYLKPFEELEAARTMPPPPASISQEEILAEGHYRSATEAERSGEHFWAIAEYEAAIRINPRHRAARRSLAKLRESLKPRVDELYQLGKRYFQEEDLHNALRAWRRALAIDPKDQRTRENVERAEKMLARLEEIQTGGE